MARIFVTGSSTFQGLLAARMRLPPSHSESKLYALMLDLGFARRKPEARANLRYFHHSTPRSPHPQSLAPGRQDRLLEICERLTGVAAP